MTTRTLFAVTVYNGQAAVPACLTSVARLTATDGVDVIVLDDASPAPGWSDEVRQLCDESGLEYYCTPRNLGIPRNVNLGLLTAVERGYDNVVICNSDIVVPTNLVEQLLAVQATDPTIGSVTAFSNNVSAYSLPNAAPDNNLDDQATVDWLSACLAGEFGVTAIDVPAGISFCVLVPTSVVREVGLMDPVFGRGYCEETDWTQRSRARGYRITLAPGTFVYHHGQGSTADAGMLSSGHTTVPANERIIDLRWPLFRSQVEAFLQSSILPTLHRSAIRRIMRDAARAFGWTLHVTWLADPPGDDLLVRAIVDPTAEKPVRLAFRGFRLELDLPDGDVSAFLRDEFGGPPGGIDVFARGPAREQVLGAFATVPVSERADYPERV